MKYPRLTFAALLAICVCLLVLKAIAEDRSGETIRYRNGSILRFDINSSIRDEDAAWSLSNAKMKALDLLSTHTGSSLGNSNLFLFLGNDGVFVTKIFVASNVSGTISASSLPAGLSTSNYVGTFTGDGTALSNVTSTAISTNADTATFASTADWATNWAGAASKAGATNASIVNTLLVTSLPDTDPNTMIARASAVQASNAVFQVQANDQSKLLAVYADNGISLNNGPTNATGGTNVLRWLFITNNGVAYVIPLHALSD